MFKKYSTEAASKTHGLVDGNLLDVVMPTTALDSTGEFVRSALFFGIGWLGRGYKENGSFGL